MSKFLYWIFGYFVRREACRLTAQVMRGLNLESPAPMVWSLTVFFESYLWHGCDWTQEDFGPKEERAHVYNLVQMARKAK